MKMQDVLDTNPRIIANQLLNSSLADIKLFSDVLHKDCLCDDHHGPHDLHVTRVILLDNFRKLFDLFDHNPQFMHNVRMINELLGFFSAEMQRQQDFITDVHLRNWAYPGKVGENDSAITQS